MLKSLPLRRFRTCALLSHMLDRQSPKGSKQKFNGERVAEASFGPPGGSIPVTLSIGVAVAQGKEELEPDRLLSNADQALYDAKSGGRDQVSARRSTAG